ncbi:MAG: hypothetical protein DRP45_09600, partial [Candidatus Zixiibacteriota bacterium]
MNPFKTGKTIKMESDDLQINHRIAQRNARTLEEIDAGVPLEELTYYRSPKERGVTPEQSTQMFIDLYRSIKDNGWTDEPYLNVAIETDGYMRTRRGRHRASILKHLGNREIEVRLTVDKEFERFADKLFAASSKREGRVYQRIDMPYFKSIPTYGGQDRINHILDACDFDGLKVLD